MVLGPAGAAEVLRSARNGPQSDLGRTVTQPVTVAAGRGVRRDGPSRQAGGGWRRVPPGRPLGAPGVRSETRRRVPPQRTGVAPPPAPD